jgi:SAM-dependent methyltransferase
MAKEYPERLAGIVLCVPSRLDPAPFADIADRVLMISGERGPAAEATARAAVRLPLAQRSVLAGYEAPGSWSDAVADRTQEIAERVIAFLGRHHADIPRAAAPKGGSHAGISYQVQGSGPALILLPFFLAPSQWTPAIPILAQHFTVVTTGGPYLGGVASLEDRARMPSYRAMFRSLIDVMAPKPGEAILEIGCGAGSLVRLLARRLGSPNPITAADVNPFLLREAAGLADAEGLAGLIQFRQGNAEALPFEDASYDCIYSVTVFEECDAGKAIAEAMRVVRPGGRGRARRAGSRHASMVESRIARGDPPQGRGAAAFRRSVGCRRPEPLSAHACGRVCRPGVLPDDGDLRPPGRPDLAQPRRPHRVAVVARGARGLACRARSGRGRGTLVHGPPATLCRWHQTRVRCRLAGAPRAFSPSSGRKIDFVPLCCRTPFHTLVDA